MTKKQIVLGIGNEILTDDGIGPKIVHRLKTEDPIDGVEYDTICLGGLEVLEYIQGYDDVIFIDAIKTSDGVPGDVSLYTPDNFKETLHLSNLHDISFLSALTLGRTVGFKIPDRIEIFAIEIVEDLVFSEHFSPELERKFPEIYNEIRSGVREIYS